MHIPHEKIVDSNFLSCPSYAPFLSYVPLKSKFENFVCKISKKVFELVPSYLVYIRKTCPCNVYPLKPHFYIVKLGYTGIYLFFLFLLQDIDCGYSLEPPRRGGSNEYPQSMSWSKNKKNIENFLLKSFNFYNLKKLCILHGHVFVMNC